MSGETHSIGVFDSGFGGLSILKEIVKELPQYSYIYLGDTARVPYGSRSQEIIYQFTVEAIDFLFAHDCDLIIIACNTASAEALRKIQQNNLPEKYPNKRVLGVIVPAVEEALEVTKNNRIGIIATNATVQSRAYEKELSSRRPEVRVFQNAAPLLVPLVEAGEDESPMITLALKQYLEPLLEKNIDTLILGCTHYGLLEEQIKAIVGTGVNIISEGPIVASKLALYLGRHPEIESKLTKVTAKVFYSTDSMERFEKLGSHFFGQPITSQKAELQ